MSDGMDGFLGRFAGKVALVTGGNSGLGFAAACALAGHGRARDAGGTALQGG